MIDLNFTTFLSKFSESLNEIMLTRELNSKAICQATGIPKQTFSSWVSGKYLPSISHLLILSNYFQLSIDYILNFSERVSYTAINSSINFFDRFEKLLKECDLSVRKFSKLVAIPTSSFTAWRHGNIPKTFSVIKLATFFDCTIEYLLGRTDIK